MRNFESYNPITQRTQINIDEKQDAPFFQKEVEKVYKCKNKLNLGDKYGNKSESEI